MLLLAAALPAMLYWLAAYRKATPDKFLLPVSLIFAGISIPISIHGIRQHLTNFWQPVLQVYVVRILWMVPVYAICSLCEQLSHWSISWFCEHVEICVDSRGSPRLLRAYTVQTSSTSCRRTWRSALDVPSTKCCRTATDGDNTATHTPIVTPAIPIPWSRTRSCRPTSGRPGGWTLYLRPVPPRHFTIRDGRAVERSGRRVGQPREPDDASVTAQLLSPKNWLDFVQFNVANEPSSASSCSTTRRGKVEHTARRSPSGSSSRSRV